MIRDSRTDDVVVDRVLWPLPDNDVTIGDVLDNVTTDYDDNRGIRAMGRNKGDANLFIGRKGSKSRGLGMTQE